MTAAIDSPAMSRWVGLVPIVVLVLSACQSMSDVKRGEGETATTTGKTYDQVWAATLKVADEHFEIRQQDKAAGTIVAERTTTAFGWGAWIGT